MKFFQIHHCSWVLMFSCWCCFYYCDCKFLQSGNIWFLHNIPTDFLVFKEKREKKERKKSQYFIVCFSYHFIVLFECFPVCVVGICQCTECTKQYLMIVMMIITVTTITTSEMSSLHPNTPQWHWLYFYKCSTQSPSQMITIIQSDINMKTPWLGNGGESEKV
jgi:hypothetical protein